MDDFNNQNNFNNSGYTVTPDGGYYGKEPAGYQSRDFYSNSFNGSTGNNFTPPNTPEKKNKKYGIFTVILASLLSAVIAVGGFYGLTLIEKEDTTPETNYISKQESSDNELGNVNITIDDTAESVVEAVNKKASKSVIGIRTTIKGTNYFGYAQESSGEGSGVIYTADGYIITNYHVIEEAAKYPSKSKIEVFLTSPSDEPYEANIVGYNISADIAVIKIDKTGLTPIDIADSSKLEIGQYVITIGAPGGLEFMGSVTYGIISGLERVVSSDSGLALIQTDAAINPGNSGGALVNTKGELVGINSSKIASVDFEGMGFAIPSNTAIDLAKEIIDNESSPEPYFGVSISETYTAEMLESYGFPVGAVISSVVEGSPAYEAGIERGDIITEFNGKEVTEYSVLKKLVMATKPGQKVKVVIYRNGKYYSTTVTIGSNNQIG